MIGEGDLDRAIIKQFGVAVAGDLVDIVKSGPLEVDQVLAVAEIEARLQRAESDFTMALGSDRNRCRLDQVEMVAIPQIGLDDPPAPIRRQLNAALTLTPPSVSATEPGYKRRPQR